MCCSPWGHKESDTTEQLNRTELSYSLQRHMLNRFSHVQLFAIPWTADGQAPLFMGFPRQEYWSGLPFPSPGNLPKQGIEPTSSAAPTLASGFFTTEPPRKPHLGGEKSNIS